MADSLSALEPTHEPLVLWEQSPSVGKLAGALAKAQGTMQPAAKDKENPFFKSKYADLASIWESIRKPLASNELCIIQTTVIRDRALILLTTLAHSSGEWIRAEYPINPLKNDPQGVGSALTYARRYAVAAITGASTEDDDGEGAVRGRDQGRHNRGPQLPPKAPHISNDPMPDWQYGKPKLEKNWEEYKYRYHLPVKKQGKDMAKVREAVKARGWRFNEEDKHWYTDEFAEKLADYIRPLEGQDDLVHTEAEEGERDPDDPILDLEDELENRNI
jgi:hypothetical protein